MSRLQYGGSPGELYFNSEAADVSLYGTFTGLSLENETWDDNRIRDFIRGGRPDLFKSLQKLPVSAEVLPEPVHLGTSHLGRDEYAMLNQNILSDLDGATRWQHSRSNMPLYQHVSLHQHRTSMLQHKRHIQSRLLSGHDIFLRCSRKPGCLLLCSALNCQQAVGHGGFFITICAMSGQPDIHYGLACLEAFFDSHRIASHPGQAFNYRALDGAAESRPIMPYQLPSNSIESRRLRQQRAQETEDILREVGKRHEVSANVAGSTQGTADVRIHRPKNLEDITERYKKQRLTRADQEQERKISRQEQQSLTDTDTSKDPAPLVAPWDREARLICYCREPENDSDLVQCSNDFCLIGWFHVECCGQSPSLLSDRRFYCDFCADPAHESDSDASGTIESDCSAREAPRTPSPPKDRADDGSEISDGFEEQVPHVLPELGGFTPINRKRRYTHDSPSAINLDGSINARSRPVINYPRPTNRLNPSFVSFADLAPFISYEIFPASPTGLTESDAVNFEAWRYSRPVSNLVTALSPRSPVTLQDLPKGSREDLRILAKQWVDHMVCHGNDLAETTLSGWLER